MKIIRVVDIAVIRGDLILLTRRGSDPFLDMWALPGGQCDLGEPPEEAAARELQEETGIVDLALQQIAVFDDAGRDPRPGLWASTVFLAIVPDGMELVAVAGDDAEAVQWWSLDNLPDLAFDHAAMIKRAMEALA